MSEWQKFPGPDGPHRNPKTPWYRHLADITRFAAYLIRAARRKRR